MIDYKLPEILITSVDLYKKNDGYVSIVKIES